MEKHTLLSYACFIGVRNDTYTIKDDTIYKNGCKYGNIISSHNNGSIKCKIDNGNMYMKGIIQTLYFGTN